jgi:hypothetical protein
MSLAQLAIQVQVCRHCFMLSQRSTAETEQPVDLASYGHAQFWYSMADLKGATMTIRYDQNLNILTIILRESSTIHESDECTHADLRTVTLESLPITKFSMTLLPPSST